MNPDSIPDNTPIKTEGFNFAANTAFPVTHGDYEFGLSKREYFAGLAMQGMLANTGHLDTSPSAIAVQASEYADSILRELAK